MSLVKNLKVRIRENNSLTSSPGTQTYLKVRSFGLIENVLGYRYLEVVNEGNNEAGGGKGYEAISILEKVKERSRNRKTEMLTNTKYSEYLNVDLFVTD